MANQENLGTKSVPTYYLWRVLLSTTSRMKDGFIHGMKIILRLKREMA